MTVLDQANLPKRYSIRISKIMAGALPDCTTGIERATGDRQNPYAIFTINGRMKDVATRVVMDAGTFVEWTGDVLDVRGIHQEHMERGELSVRLYHYTKCRCGKANGKTGKTQYYHLECTCHDLIGEGWLDLNTFLHKQRRTLSESVALERPEHGVEG